MVRHNAPPMAGSFWAPVAPALNTAVLACARLRRVFPTWLSEARMKTLDDSDPDVLGTGTGSSSRVVPSPAF